VKGPDRNRLLKLFRMLGSDNFGERENTRAIIDEILRKHRMSWNDLVELVQAGPAETGHTVDDDDVAPPANVGAGVTALDMIHCLLEEYNELENPHDYVAVALWGLHCHVYKQFTITPRLALVSPVRGCGKTTLLALLELLTARGRRDDSTTAAALLRLISRESCTLLLDEADNLGLGQDGILRAIINSGHRRGGGRTLLYKGEPKRFATHAPLAIASIGILPLPIMHRSIVIHMRRATRALRRLDGAEAIDVAYSMARAWAHEAKLNPDPELPKELRNRPADNWRPLISIADSFGHAWGKRARQAAVHFSRAYHDEDLSVILLGDIRCVFDTRGAAKLASATLVEDLVGMDDAPWADWCGLLDDQRPRRLTQSELARLLAPFGIRPQTIWPRPRTKRTKSAKGYARLQFEVAWRQFCDSAGTPAHESKAGRLQRN
jgi:hypothetical protein